jgi:hypothetical protein
MAVSSIKSFPHPVLGNGDDVAGQLNVSYAVASDPAHITISYKFELKNKTIEQLISNGSATYCIQLECSSTFYRYAYKTNVSDGEFQIDANQVRDRVEISFSICATKTIDEYMPEGCHPDYAGEPFTIEAGDIIGEGGSDSFFALKSFDALRAPVSSIMRIKQGSKQTGPMLIDYEASDKVVIELPKDDWDTYTVTSKYTPSTVHASIVLPALIDVLYQMEVNKDMHEGTSWFMRLTEMCRTRSVSLTDHLEAAQKLLSTPINRSLTELTKKLGDDGQEELL